MTTITANRLIQSISLNLLIDGEITPPMLESATHNYLTGKITHAQLLAKTQSFSSSSALLFFRCLELLTTQAPTNFNTDALLNIHAYLHKDTYPKCGVLRKKNLETAGGSHTDFKYLKGSLKSVLNRLNSSKGVPAISKTDFTALLAHYMQELNILSPFAFANGITRRVFFTLFALSRGFEINFTLSSKKEFAYAEAQAFVADNPQPLFTCLVKCVNYIGKDASLAPHTIARTSQSLRLKNLRPTKRARKYAKTPTAPAVTYFDNIPPDEPNLLPDSFMNDYFNKSKQIIVTSVADSNEEITKKIQTIQDKLTALNTELNDLLSTIQKK